MVKKEEAPAVKKVEAPPVKAVESKNENNNSTRKITINKEILNGGPEESQKGGGK